jgi:hypothetical protein
MLHLGPVGTVNCAFGVARPDKGPQKYSDYGMLYDTRPTLA